MFVGDLFQQRVAIGTRMWAREIEARRVRTKAGPRHGWIACFALVILATAFIESGFVFRFWTQLSGQALNSEWKRLLYSTSGTLARPFASYETFDSRRSTGILQYSGLIAAEAYLIAALATLVVVYFWRSPFNRFWSIVWQPFAISWRWVKAGAAWISRGAAFSIARVIDEPTFFYLERVRPASRSALEALLRYLSRKRAVVQAGFVRVRETGRQLGSLSARAFGRTNTELRKLARELLRYLSRKRAVVQAGLVRVRETGRQLSSLSARAFVRTNAELRKLAREAAAARARNYRG